MDYVIGALQQKLPRAPLPFNPALLVPQTWCNLIIKHWCLLCLSLPSYL